MIKAMTHVRDVAGYLECHLDCPSHIHCSLCDRVCGKQPARPASATLRKALDAGCPLQLHSTSFQGHGSFGTIRGGIHPAVFKDRHVVGHTATGVVNWRACVTCNENCICTARLIRRIQELRSCISYRLPQA